MFSSGTESPLTRIGQKLFHNQYNAAGECVFLYMLHAVARTRIFISVKSVGMMSDQVQSGV